MSATPKLRTLAVAALLLLSGCGQPGELETHVDGIHREYLTIMGLPDTDPDDGSVGYGQNDDEIDEPDCNQRGGRLVAFRQLTPDNTMTTSAVDFTQGTAWELAPKAAKHLEDSGWEIQRYNGGPGYLGSRIIVGHREQNGYSDFIETINAEGGYTGFIRSYANCDRRRQEPSIGSLWEPVDTFE